MAKKPYSWADGVILQEHTKRKLTILRQYFADYIRTRCQLPQQERFRLAVIDGFAGAGRYKCGAAGSPIIFIEELQKAAIDQNISRAKQGLKLIGIECLLVLNDEAQEAVNILKENIAPIQVEFSKNNPHLHLKIEYLSGKFDSIYPRVKARVKQGRYRNIIFNLDQFGHSSVRRDFILDIVHSYQSVEIFYTFAIKSLLAFLPKSNRFQLEKELGKFGFSPNELLELEGIMSRTEWLGTAERLVFDNFKKCAPFISPFSINNPDGWRYWMIHFANSYRARQVYNNILHSNSTLQAHFGRSGLEMLSYVPHEGSLYLFDEPGRLAAQDQLKEDVPRFISQFGDAVRVDEFYETIYNETPAHSDDIHQSIIEHPDIEIITTSGGGRRKANSIRIDDMIRLKKQPTLFPMFGTDRKNDEAAV